MAVSLLCVLKNLLLFAYARCLPAIVFPYTTQDVHTIATSWPQCALSLMQVVASIVHCMFDTMFC